MSRTVHIEYCSPITREVAQSAEDFVNEHLSDCADMTDEQAGEWLLQKWRESIDPRTTGAHSVWLVVHTFDPAR